MAARPTAGPSSSIFSDPRSAKNNATLAARWLHQAWVYLVPNSFSFAPSKIILLGYRECAEPDSNVGMAHQCARLISKFGSDAIASQPAVPPSELSHLCPI